MDSYRTLIIGPSWVGDMVMAQSLFKLLKKIKPNVLIDVLAPSWTFSLLACMKEVNQAIEMPIHHGELKLKTRYQIAKQLQTHQYYHQAIVLPNSFKSALIPYFARIPQRTGWRREGRQWLLNDSRRLDKSRYRLMIEQYMALALPAEAELPLPYPYPEFNVTTYAQETVINQLNPTMTGAPILALAPGAEFGPSKRWPAEYYAEVAKEKLTQGWNVWLFGSPKDVAIADEIMKLTQHGCENMTGRTTLEDTIALLSLKSVAGVISNDSGLMHIAAALSKPLIAIYGSTSTEFTPPLNPAATILKLNLDCQPCFKRECPLKHHRCMLDLTPAKVISAINQHWGH